MVQSLNTLELEFNELGHKGKLGYQLTQELTIKKILSNNGMTDCNRKATPNSGKAPMVTNTDGDPARY